ncbi:O-antigen ligase family protein [Bacillus cereus group sp. RP43]|uniref:O-antigen ligase family protein n=1 Tax=Bacillus cereus group sp. RP43 TaxID=3040260 RepID=UPI003393380A
MSVVTASIPYGVFLPLFLVVCVVFIVVPYKKIINSLWIGILVTSFLGSYLGIPGNQSIFLFRILLMLHCIMFLFFDKKEWNRLSYFKIHFILLGIWLAGSGISLFWAGIRIEAIRYIYYIFEACYLILLIVYYVYDQKSYRYFVNVIIFFYILAIFIGIIEVFTGWHMSLSGSLFYETLTSKFQPTAFLYNTNDYAMFLAIFFPLVFCRIWRMNVRPWNIYFAILLLLLSLYLIITTYSRMGIIAIVLEVSIIFVFYMRKSIVFIVFGLSVYLLIESFLQQNSQMKVEQIIISAFTKKGASTDERMNLYQTSWDIIRDSHFLGIGAGNVPIQINSYLTGHESMRNAYRAPHNFWLESIGGIGFFSFAIVGLIIISLYLSIRIWMKHGHITNTIQYLIPLLIVIVFIFSSIALSTIIEKRYLWLALGLAIRMINIEFIEKKEGD